MGKRASRSCWQWWSLAALFLLAGARSGWATDGHFLHGVGALDSAMGGSGTALALDAVGTIFNNVALPTEIPGFRFDVSFELFEAQRTVRSTLAGASGSTESESDITPIPAIGLTYTPRKDGRITYFLGALGIMGFGVDYPEDSSNPILQRQIAGGANTGGFGHIFSSYQLLKFAGGIAYRVTPSVSVGVAPNIDYATLAIEPMPAALPDCTGGGVCAYPSASNQVGAFGVGFQVGVHYRYAEWLHVGVGYTSPQWFESFRWNSSVANSLLPTFGAGRAITFRLDAPQVVAFGVAVKPRTDLLLAANAKWFNYSDTEGFDEEGFDVATGRVKGFGWRDIWAFGVGAQYRPVDWLALRLGYNFSQNPIPDRLSFFNVPAPAIVQHHLTAGFGMEFSERVEVNVAYYHAFRNRGSGPFVSASTGDSVPGSRVEHQLSEDSAVLQLSFKY